MSTTVSAVIPAGDAAELEEFIKSSGGQLSASAVLRDALRKYLDARPSFQLPITLETQPSQMLQPAPDKELGESLRAAVMSVIDFIPVISTRGDSGSVTTSYSKDTLRAIDVLLATPGIRQRTRSDLVRALVHYGLLAIDRMRYIDSPMWRIAMVAARQRQAYERSVAISEDLYQGACALRDSLAVALARGQDDEAIGLWVSYFRAAETMPDAERDIMFRVLLRMPLAQFVAWTGRESGMFPEEFIPGEVPDISSPLLDPDVGMPMPPQVRSKRDLAAAYQTRARRRQSA